MPTEAIRVRIAARDDTSPPPRDPRASFWEPWRGSSPDLSNASITQFEAKLCREFGHSLSSALVQHLSEPFRTMDSHLFPSPFRELERLFFHFPERELYRYQIADVLGKLLEQRQQEFRENPSLRHTQDRIAAAAGVMFATKIVGYSSMTLDVTTGSFLELSKAFDGNFDTFRVFLDAFIPTAFADVFSQEFADRLDFSATVPASTQQAFEAASATSAAAHTRAVPDSGAAPPVAPTAAARERAEWLWRLANGSLLVPVLLSLFVMYYGLRMITDIRSAQFEAMKPILDHQLKLLEQDRLRMGREVPTGAGSAVPAAGAPPSAPKVDKRQ